MWWYIVWYCMKRCWKNREIKVMIMKENQNIHWLNFCGSRNRATWLRTFDWVLTMPVCGFVIRGCNGCGTEGKRGCWLSIWFNWGWPSIDIDGCWGGFNCWFGNCPLLFNDCNVCCCCCCCCCWLAWFW